MTAGLKENKKLKEMDKRREERESKDSAPPIIAFTMRHSTGVTWEFVKMHIKDGKVVNEKGKWIRKIGDEETFQIEFVREFIYGQ